MSHDYECVIVGGGPAGLTAGIYCARAKIKTLLIEKENLGGQIALTDLVENYPGFPEGISGKELTLRMKRQAEKFGLNIMRNEAINLYMEGEKKIVTLKDKVDIKTLSIILTLGVKHRKLNVPGEKEFINRGVSYCATCDGPLFEGMDVAVIGGGDSAVQESLFLTKFCRRVFLVHRRDKLRAKEYLQERMFSNEKIVFLPNRVVKRIEGKDFVERIILFNKEKETDEELEVNGVFIFIGMEPNTDIVRGKINLDERGYIITDEKMRTNIKGVFAAGDCRSGSTGQVAVAVGEGCIAGMETEAYLSSIKS